MKPKEVKVGKRAEIYGAGIDFILLVLLDWPLLRSRLTFTIFLRKIALLPVGLCEVVVNIPVCARVSGLDPIFLETKIYLIL